MPEDQTIEWKSAWHDDQFKVLCGFANARGGLLILGLDDTSRPVGLSDPAKLLEELPQKIPQVLGITPDIQLVPATDNRDTIEIRVAPSTVPISLCGRHYQRNGPVTKEIQGTSLNEFLLHKCGLTWDAVIEGRASFDDIDPTAVKRFLADSRHTGRLWRPPRHIHPPPRLRRTSRFEKNHPRSRGPSNPRSRAHAQVIQRRDEPAGNYGRPSTPR